MKFTVKYSDDRGKTVKESEPYSNGDGATDLAWKLHHAGHIVYGIYKDGKRI